MRIIVFGATGMVGQGVLEACLRDAAVDEVLVIGRTPTGRVHPKLRELHHEDFTDLTSIDDKLTGYDACFYCLGTSACGDDRDRLPGDLPRLSAPVTKATLPVKS